MKKYNIKRSTLNANIFVFSAIIFLYLPLFNVAGYQFNFGTASAVFLVLLSLPQLMHKSWRHSNLLVLAWIAPLVIYTGHVILSTTYALEFFEFFKSYALWCVSSFLIWLAFQDHVKFYQANWTALLVVVVAFSCLQYVDKIFGSGVIVDIVKAVGLYRPEDYGTEAARQGMKFRAVGAYYEPSMLGRVICTLSAVVLVTRQKFSLVMISLAAGIIVSKSFSIVILGLAMLVIVYGRASAKSAIVLLSLLVAFVAFGDFIYQRINIVNGVTNSSSYIRLIMPMFAVSQVLPAYPFGVPIGSNELVVEMTLAPIFAYHEPKITNGLYEFVLLFGISAIGAIIFILGRIFIHWLNNRSGEAIIGLFLLLSTAASSSYLNIESSLMLYLMITSIRVSMYQERCREEADRMGLEPVFYSKPVQGGVSKSS